jgi:hypothetical protein
MRNVVGVVTALVLLASGIALAWGGGSSQGAAATQYQYGKGCGSAGAGAVQYQYGKPGCGPWKTGGQAGKSGAHTGPPGKTRSR